MKTRSLIGLFGGSFDPFHNGHLAMVEAAVKAFPLEKLLVMPVGLPPHKSRRLNFSTFRVETARLATQHLLPQVSVSEREILSQGCNYTVDTIKMLQKDYPDIDIKLVSGSDFLFTVEQWYQYESILSLVSFAIALRGNTDKDKSEKQADYLREKYNAKITFFPMQKSTVSATQVRKLLTASASAKELLPEKVNNLLEIYRPYSFKETLDSLSEDNWQQLNDCERRLFEFLGPERRLHSVSTCLLSLKLAAVHGVSALDAGIAALLHDVAKELSLKEQSEYAKSYLGFEESNPELRHGPAAAYLAKNLFGVKSKNILNAIQYHTSGRPGMSRLEKIIFLADKIEYGRPFKNLEIIRSLALAEGADDSEKEVYLDLAVCRCLEEVFTALERSNQEICPLSKEAYNVLK